MKSLLLVLLALMVSACAYDPDTRLRLLEGTSAPQTTPSVTCSGFLQWSDCYTLASRKCESSYRVIQREEDLISQRRELFYRCN